MSSQPFATGQCLCGAVKYTILSAPVRSAQCHCKACQRASGTGHMSLSFFAKDQVEIAGDYKEHASTADSGNVNTRAFCGECGSRLFGRNSARPGIIAVAVGCVDNNDWFQPEVIVYHQDKPNWDCMDSAITTFDAMPPPPEAK